MKHYSVFLATVALVLASISCQTLTGARNETPNLPPTSVNESPDLNQPTAEVPEDEVENMRTTDFPLTDDASNITETAGTLVFYTKLSAEDAMEFYRNEYSSRGYTEREILTVVSDGTFSMVFDGDPSGKAVVVQSVDLGDGNRTISIRLEDV
jgi:hypothetical protein